MNQQRNRKEPFQSLGNVDGVSLRTITPAWASWLCFLIGVTFLSLAWRDCFRPQRNANGWTLFQHPDDASLGPVSMLCIFAFSGCGAAMLVHRSRMKSQRWTESLKISYPDEPWKWQPDWLNGQLRAERLGGRGYVIVWGILCLLSAAPYLEPWFAEGRRWPKDLVTLSACAVAIIGTLTILIQLRRLEKSRRASRSLLHMAAPTGVIGGSIEGAIDCGSQTPFGECLVRIVCEKHTIALRRGSEGGTTRSHEISIVHEDTYRADAHETLVPVRFGIPFERPETTVDWLTPVHLWFVELEDLQRRRIARFWIPVFKNAESDPEFELSSAAADRLISEESPTETLQRFGISVQDLPNGRTRIIVPPGRSWQLDISVGIFGLLCLSIATFMMTQVLKGWAAGGMGMLIAGFAAVFVTVFGLFGLLMTLAAGQSLFERRRVEVDANGVQIRKSYLGVGWTQQLSWENVRSLNLTRAGSIGGQRNLFQNVTAQTDGMLRKNGTMMPRRHSIIRSVPATAAEAAKRLLESFATLPPDDSETN